MTSDQYSKESNVLEEEKKSESMKMLGKSSTGLEANVAGLVCYLFGFISGLIMFLMEKDSHYVRFHAMQSILVNVTLFFAVFILNIIPIIGWLVSLFIFPISLFLWIFMMYKAYQGEKFKLPWVGEIADQQAEKL